MITGIDLSEHNGSIDWDLLGNGEVHFVYLKASEALASVDSAFEENRQGAQEQGILCGAYHWLHPGLHVGQQVDLFVQTVKSFKGLLPPVICMETHSATPDEMEKSVRAFLSLVERKAGVKPIIYTSENYWKAHLPEAVWGCEYKLWIDKPGSTWPAQLWPWAGWTLWQFSYETRLPGVPINVGLNRFNGTRAELEAMVIPG